MVPAVLRRTTVAPVPHDVPSPSLARGCLLTPDPPPPSPASCRAIKRCHQHRPPLSFPPTFLLRKHAMSTTSPPVASCPRPTTGGMPPPPEVKPLPLTLVSSHHRRSSPSAVDLPSSPISSSCKTSSTSPHPPSHPLAAYCTLLQYANHDCVS
jgi:hypothetical protein